MIRVVQLLCSVHLFRCIHIVGEDAPPMNIQRESGEINKRKMEHHESTIPYFMPSQLSLNSIKRRKRISSIKMQQNKTSN